MSRGFYLPGFKVKLEGTYNSYELKAPVCPSTKYSVITLDLLDFLGYKDFKTVKTLPESPAFKAYRFPIKVIAGEREFTLYMVPVVAGKGFKRKTVMFGGDFFKQIKSPPLYLESFLDLYNQVRKFRKNFVLIIGKDDKKYIPLLYKIKEHLRKFSYEGIILKDYPDIEEQSLEEKMNLLGNLAKFVICENSYPSGHIDELNICTRNRLVTVVLQKENVKGGSTWMQACYPIDFNFIRRIFYKPESLNRAVDKAVKLAESLVEKRKQALNKEYKYREAWLKEITGRQ